MSPGNLAKAVILVTFLQIRAPLYKIKDAFFGVDAEALFGEGVMPEHLNDDAIARAVDRISGNIDILFGAVVSVIAVVCSALSKAGSSILVFPPAGMLTGGKLIWQDY